MPLRKALKVSHTTPASGCPTWSCQKSAIFFPIWAWARKRLSQRAFSFHGALDSVEGGHTSRVRTSGEWSESAYLISDTDHTAMSELRHRSMWDNDKWDFEKHENCPSPGFLLLHGSHHLTSSTNFFKAVRTYSSPLHHRGGACPKGGLGSNWSHPAYTTAHLDDPVGTPVPPSTPDGYTNASAHFKENRRQYKMIYLPSSSTKQSSSW